MTDLMQERTIHIYFSIDRRYSETSLHIGSECMVSFGITFALIKNSIFTNKFSDII
jgi:hypothetical protein